MRDPSIHIRKSDLIDILKDVKLADKLLFESTKLGHNLRNRVQVTFKSSSKLKVERLFEADNTLTDEFNRIYSAIMLEKSIKTMTIRRGSSAYTTLQGVAAQAVEFCDLFQLQKEEGFRVYIHLGIKLLGKKYNLNRLKGSAQRIVDNFSNALTLKNDKTPADTFAMYKAWLEVLQKYFHVQLDVYNDPDKYVHFVYAKEDADLLKATYLDWCTAQFEKWSYLNVIPEFSQLHGENSVLVYKKFVAQYSKQFDSPEEQNYFKNIKDEKKIVTKASVKEAEAKQSRLHRGLEKAGSANA